MKILVTGGSGFIGKHLVQRLQKLDHIVDIMDYINPNFECNYIGQFVEDCKDKYDLIYNLAAHSRVDRCELHDAVDNIETLGRILEKSRHEKTKVIFTSSWLAKFPHSSYYAYSKKSCEDLCALYRRIGVNIQVARISNVYGNNHSEPTIIDRLLNNEDIPIYTKYTRNFIHVSDVVTNLIEISENNIQYAEISHETYTIDELVELFGLQNVEKTDAPNNIVRFYGDMSNCNILSKPKFNLKDFVLNYRYF